MKKFLINNWVWIVGIPLLKLGVPFWIVTIMLLLFAVLGFFKMLYSSLMSAGEEQVDVDSKEYLERFMPKN